MDTICSCPKCNSDVFDQNKLYKCSNDSCDFIVWKSISSYKLKSEDIISLIQNRRTSLIKDFVSKKGNNFEAYIVFDNDFKTKFEFDNN